MQFNADDHQDQFAPLTGQHRFRIDAVKNDFTKGGDPVLVFDLKIVEGPFKGRLHWDRFIVEHANPKTVEIAMGKLSSLSRAVGCPQWGHESELVGRVGEAVFGPQKDAPEFTEIKRYIVDSAAKAAPSANPHRTAARAPSIDQRGGQLAETLAAQSGGPAPAPHPADGFDDVPF